LNRQTIAAAAESAVEGAQPLEKNAYKIPLFRGMIEEELERMSRPEAA
jgi:CO/xanthine dehydrogenase FAD-binding subunit